MEVQRLTMHSYSEDIAQERRITISPMQVSIVAAAIEDITIRGLSLRNVDIMFADGQSIALILNHADLSTLESAIGSYCLGM